MTSVTIPDSVTTIGTGAFAYCYALTSVFFENPTGWTDDTGETVDFSNAEDAADILKNNNYYTSYTRA